MHGAIHPAALRRIIDADTQMVLYFLGFGLLREGRARLARLNAAEYHGAKVGSPEWKRGEEQMLWVRDWYQEAEADWKHEWPLLIEVVGPDKFGRDLVSITRQSDRRCLNDDLICRWPEIAAG